MVTPPLAPDAFSSPSDAFDVAGRHVYMIGIGGCGMSGLARMLASRGAIVQGSDNSPSESTAALAAESIRVTFSQLTDPLPERCDLVIASAAIKPDHPQLAQASRRDIPAIWYAEALGRCMLGRTAIAVAGTHGKSTTTAMTGCALTDAGLDPTVIVGATSSQLLHGANAPITRPAGFRLGANSIPDGRLAGRPGILVAEACEHNRSFHNYRPQLAAITSVEADHLDVYGTLDAVVESFHHFATLLPPASQGGTLLIAHDNAHRREVTAGLDCDVQTIGFTPSADWVVGYDPSSRGVTLHNRREFFAQWQLAIPGAHNAMNSAVACVLATLAGADTLAVARSLASFRGIDRRMQLIGVRPSRSGGHVRVYDDYGHHPTEVDVTLRALREHERPEERGGRLICVFQPHQHSRTRHLLDEFAQSFSSADIVIVPDIYFVRDSEEERHKVTAADLVDRLRQRGVRAMHLYPFAAIIEQLETICHDGDVVVAMGAGNVYEVAKGFVAAAHAHPSEAGPAPTFPPSLLDLAPVAQRLARSA